MRGKVGQIKSKFERASAQRMEYRSSVMVVAKTQGFAEDERMLCPTSLV